MSFDAVILAGGKSSRMGRDKAFLEMDGNPLLTRQIETARAAGAGEIIISGRRDTDYTAFGLRVVHDYFPDAGPLAGIHAALWNSQGLRLLVLPVDLPRLNASFLVNLVNASNDRGGVIPCVDGRIEPLVALYPRAAGEIAATMLRADNFAVRDFAAACVAAGWAVFVHFPPAAATWFHNANSPADLPCTT